MREQAFSRDCFLTNLDAEEAEAVIVKNDVASGRIDEDSLAAWISQRAVPFDLDAD